jgi:DNA helicase-2/ATP-dependent DNA helicase PcrA
VNETDDWDTDTDKVTLMTLHAAKGLEFPVVFIVAVEDGVLPHERVGRHPDELEEERRLAFVGLTRAKEELQLSYAVTRDFRGVRRRTIPSSFLMEMPREELELMDEATAYIAQHEQDRTHAWGDDATEEWCGDGAPDPREASISLHSNDEWHIDEVIAESADGSPPDLTVVASSITTAAALERETGGTDNSPARKSAHQPAVGATALPRVSPDVFQQGMTVTHPEYGPGKIVALSGSGKNRRATVQFPSVGEKKIILAHSPLRPAR